MSSAKRESLKKGGVTSRTVKETFKYHETKETFTLPINGIKAFRAEKVSGDGKI